MSKRWSARASLSVVTVAVLLVFTEDALSQMRIDLDGDGQKEEVVYEEGGLAVRDGADGKLALLMKDLPDLTPGTRQQAVGLGEVWWEEWSYGAASTLVIVEMRGGSHVYFDVYIVYQGTRSRPVFQMIAQGARGAQLQDVNEDGVTELVVWLEKIADPEPLWTESGPSLAEWLVKARGQDCVSEADKRPVPYVFTCESVGDEFRCLPLSLTSERLRRMAEIREDWITSLSVLYQKTRVQKRELGQGRVILSNETFECDEDMLNMQ